MSPKKQSQTLEEIEQDIDKIDGLVITGLAALHRHHTEEGHFCPEQGLVLTCAITNAYRQTHNGEEPTKEFIRDYFLDPEFAEFLTALGVWYSAFGAGISSQGASPWIAIRL